MRIVHVSLAAIATDGRVLRAMHTGRELGAVVSAVAPGTGLDPSVFNLAMKLRVGLAYGIGGRLSTRATRAAFWSFDQHRQALKQTIAAKPSIVHAHDWNALPIAVAAAEQTGCQVLYDSHEFAADMHSERALWRMTMPAAIHRIEDSLISRAAHVITVSEGLASAIAARYRLPRKPSVVRSTPFYKDTSNVRRAADGILLHYHGVLARGRGLMMAVDTLSLLPEPFRLRLLGEEKQPGYVAAIRERARQKGVAHRIEILPAVPVEDLANAAADAHVGLCMLSAETVHNRFALPNKLFEYLMAGLLPAVSGSAEMERLIEEAGTGLSFATRSAPALAAALHQFAADDLTDVRERALKIARRYCWEVESKSLIEIYRRLAKRPL